MFLPTNRSINGYSICTATSYTVHAELLTLFTVGLLAVLGFFLKGDAAVGIAGLF